MSFWLGYLVNELPFLAFFVLAASTALAIVQGDIANPVGWIGLGLAVLATAGSRRDRSAGAADRRRDRPRPDRGRAARSVAATPASGPGSCSGRSPFRTPVSSGSRTSRTATRGARTCSTCTALARSSAGGPTLIHLHGGAFRIGNKSREARPLFYRLARRGWVCISANYRLRAQFPDPLVDVKKVLAWVREHGPEYGADPSVVFVAGSSAGGHLASMAALTANDPSLQPGFEEADTSVTAVVSLYGYYGPAGPGRSSPMALDGHGAPPFFVAHPDRDTLVVVDDARRFVEHSAQDVGRTRSSTRSCPARSTRSTSSTRSGSRR